RAELVADAPAIAALAAGEKDALRGVASGLLAAAEALAQKDPQQRPAFDALAAELSAAFGADVGAAAQVGPGDAERSALIKSELAAAKAGPGRGRAAGLGAATLGRLSVARELLRTTPPAARAPFGPAIEDLSTAARMVAEEARNDATHELMILVSDV